MPIDVINPASGELLKRYDLMGHEEVNGILGAMGECQKQWANTMFVERYERFSRLAELLRSKRKELATIITQEMGKPIRQAMSEVEKCAWLCDYYIETAETHLQSESIKTNKTTDNKEER